MNKVLTEIYLPSINKSYDVFLPKQISIYEAINMLSTMMYNLSDGFFKPSNDTILCNKITGEIYDINKSIKDLNLQNGSKLMLI